MQVIINHPNGKQYRLPAHQVVVYNDDGHPVAMTYEHANLLIHTDVSHTDFDRSTLAMQVKSIGPMPKAEEPERG